MLLLIGIWIHLRCGQSFYKMSYKKYLLECIDLYYVNVFARYHFIPIESYDDANGAYNVYSNKLFQIKVINNRGLIITEIAPLNSKNRFVELDVILKFIRLADPISNGLNPFERKLIANRKYSCEEHAVMIERYYDAIILLLSMDQFDSIVKRVQ
jgi:hypothetical protein